MVSVVGGEGNGPDKSDVVFEGGTAELGPEGGHEAFDPVPHVLWW